MSLLQYLLSEGKKDVMVNKIGIPEQYADEIQREFGKKFQFVVATILKKMTPEGAHMYKMALGQNLELYKNDFKRLERFAKENNFPNINFNNLKNIDSSDKLRGLNSMFQSIKDYREGATPTPQLTGMSIPEAYNLSEEWHEQLEASGRQLDIKDDQIIIREFDDKYYWLDLNTTNCEDEGDSMGHCGNTSADTLLSLRDPKGEPHITVAYDYDGTFRQMKGKGNDKPHEKYHPYIIDLIMDSTVSEEDPNTLYQFIKYDPEYKREDDFSLLDLDKQLLKEVYDNMDEEIFYGLFFDTFSYNWFLEVNGMMDSYNNSLIMEDLSNIFPFEERVQGWNMHKFNTTFQKFNKEFGDDYIVEKFIDHGASENKLEGMKFITVLHHINIHRNKTDLIADAIINNNEFHMVSAKIETTTFSFIFAK